MNFLNFFASYRKYASKSSKIKAGDRKSSKSSKIELLLRNISLPQYSLEKFKKFNIFLPFWVYGATLTDREQLPVTWIRAPGSGGAWEGLCLPSPHLDGSRSRCETNLHRRGAKLFPGPYSLNIMQLQEIDVPIYDGNVEDFCEKKQETTVCRAQLFDMIR